MLKQKKTVTTLQNELSTFREAFEDQKNECESEIQKRRTEMNKRHQEEMKQELIESRKETEGKKHQI